MSSDNPSGADNQQERPSSSHWLDRIPSGLGHYIAGFVDGEGSFNVPIRRARDRSMPWRAALSFNVSQVGAELPELLRVTFGAGTVRNRGDGVFYFEVTRPAELRRRVFPFFERYSLRGPKRRDLETFRLIATIVESGEHRTPAGLRRILEMRGPMNRGGNRRRSDDEVLRVLEEWESSEAIRRAP